MQNLLIVVAQENKALALTRPEVPLENLAKVAKNNEVTLLIPAEEVVLTQVTLPKLSKSRRQQALPFALEEQLIADVDTLHFASFPTTAQDVAVGIIAKEKMDEYLALLKQWQVVADRVLPTCLAIPFEAGKWHVAIYNHQAVVRTGLYQGFGCEIENLQEMLQLQLANSEKLPDEIVVSNYTENKRNLILGAPVSENLYPQHQFLADLNLDNDFNLLQSNYRVTKLSGVKAKRLQYMAMGLASVLMAGLFIYPSVSYFLLQHRLNQIENEITKIYKHNFPLASTVVSPKLRLESKLRKLTSGNVESNFLNLLNGISETFNDISNVRVMSLDYQNNQFTIQTQTSSSEDLTHLVEALKKEGLKVRELNVDEAGDSVNASLVVG